MELITHSLPASAAECRKVFLRTDRHTLAKRRWRGRAEDGQDFGFDLEWPLRHGDAFFETPGQSYIIQQAPEPVLAVLIVTPAQAARVAWQIGNLHFPAAIIEDSILTVDDLALRQMFDRERISYRLTEAIFQPLSAAAGHHHHHH